MPKSEQKTSLLDQLFESFKTQFEENKRGLNDAARVENIVRNLMEYAKQEGYEAGLAKKIAEYFRNLPVGNNLKSEFEKYIAKPGNDVLRVAYKVDNTSYAEYWGEKYAAAVNFTSPYWEAVKINVAHFAENATPYFNSYVLPNTHIIPSEKGVQVDAMDVALGLSYEGHKIELEKLNAELKIKHTLTNNLNIPVRDAVQAANDANAAVLIQNLAAAQQAANAVNAAVLVQNLAAAQAAHDDANPAALAQNLAAAQQAVNDANAAVLVQNLAAAQQAANAVNAAGLIQNLAAAQQAANDANAAVLIQNLADARDAYNEAKDAYNALKEKIEKMHKFLGEADAYTLLSRADQIVGDAEYLAEKVEPMLPDQYQFSLPEEVKAAAKTTAKVITPLAKFGGCMASRANLDKGTFKSMLKVGYCGGTTIAPYFLSETVNKFWGGATLLVDAVYNPTWLSKFSTVLYAGSNLAEQYVNAPTAAAHGLKPANDVVMQLTKIANDPNKIVAGIDLVHLGVTISKEHDAYSKMHVINDADFPLLQKHGISANEMLANAAKGDVRADYNKKLLGMFAEYSKEFAKIHLNGGKISAELAKEVSDLRNEIKKVDYLASSWIAKGYADAWKVWAYGFEANPDFNYQKNVKGKTDEQIAYSAFKSGDHYFAATNGLGEKIDLVSKIKDVAKASVHIKTSANNAGHVELYPEFVTEDNKQCLEKYSQMTITEFPKFGVAGYYTLDCDYQEIAA